MALEDVHRNICLWPVGTFGWLFQSQSPDSFNTCPEAEVMSHNNVQSLILFHLLKAVLSLFSKSNLTIESKWCFWTVVLEKTLESPLDSKEIQPVNPNGNQSWIFTGRTDAEAEAQILWPSDAKNWLIGKDTDAGEDWRQEEKWVTEDETVGWHHWLDGHESEQTAGDSEGQGILVCCSPRGHNLATEQQQHYI